MRNSTRRRTLIGSMALIFGLVATGCATAGSENKQNGSVGEPVAGGVLEIGAEGQPSEGLDPHVIQTFVAQGYVSQLYEGLLSLDSAGEIQPGLAKSYEQIDKTTYQFKLREGVTFHEGGPFTADDAVFSLLRMVDPEINSPYSSLYKISDATALDDLTVEVKLSEPQSSLYNFLARPWSGAMMDREWTEARTQEEIKSGANGTGPFVLTTWTDGVDLKMDSNDHYWGDEGPYVDGLRFRFVADESSRIAALRSRESHMTMLQDSSLAEQVQRSGSTVMYGPPVRSFWMAANTTSGPLSDEGVRQAFSMALDRDILLAALNSPEAQLGYVIPPGDPYGVKPPSEDHKQDIEGAKNLLVKAGYENLTLTVSAPSDPNYAVDVALLELMKSQVAEVGINLELDLKPWGTHLPNLLEGNWNDLMVMQSVLNADPSQYLQLWFAEGSPMTHVKDPTLWKMMSDGEKTSDIETRKEIYKEISEYVAKKAYIIVPAARQNRIETWAQEVQGYEVDATGTRLNLKNVWLEK